VGDGDRENVGKILRQSGASEKENTSDITILKRRGQIPFLFLGNPEEEKLARGNGQRGGAEKKGGNHRRAL